MTGLEACVDLTRQYLGAERFEKDKLFDIIRDPEAVPSNVNLKQINQLVAHLMMRARYNTQRHYEIYTLRTDSSITANDLKTMFEDSPQTAADLVRSRGNKLYSDRIKNTEQRIV
jgi:hypothetical protein